MKIFNKCLFLSVMLAGIYSNAMASNEAKERLCNPVLPRLEAVQDLTDQLVTLDVAISTMSPVSDARKQLVVARRDMDQLQLLLVQDRYSVKDFCSDVKRPTPNQIISTEDQLRQLLAAELAVTPNEDDKVGAALGKVIVKCDVLRSKFDQGTIERTRLDQFRDKLSLLQVKLLKNKINAQMAKIQALSSNGVER